MCVDRNLPLSGQIRQGSHVIEMPVSQHNHLGLMARELRLCPAFDARRGHGKAAVDEYPSRLASDGIDVHHHDAESEQTGRDIVQRDNLVVMNLNAFTHEAFLDFGSACFSCKCAFTESGMKRPSSPCALVFMEEA